MVLKGHIGLDTAIFPPGTTGHRLDTLARMHLWKVGLDYRHVFLIIIQINYHFRELDMVWDIF